MRERDYLDTLLHPADGSAHTGPSTFDSHDSELLGYLLLALLTVIAHEQTCELLNPPSFAELDATVQAEAHARYRELVEKAAPGIRPSLRDPIVKAAFINGFRGGWIEGATKMLARWNESLERRRAQESA